MDNRNDCGSELLARFDRHPDPAIDFCIEVEELENIADGARLGLTGNGHEEEQASLDTRIQRAMEFRVGGDAGAAAAKAALRKLAQARGFTVTGAIAYAGQPLAASKADPSHVD